MNHGDVYTILGTTCCTGIVCHDIKRINRQTRFVPHALSGNYINLFAMQSGTPNIDWALSQLAENRDFSHISTQLKAIPAGCGGVFYQPYINGERAPFYSPSARAGFSVLANTPQITTYYGQFLKVWLTPSKILWLIILLAAGCIWLVAEQPRACGYRLLLIALAARLSPAELKN